MFQQSEAPGAPVFRVSLQSAISGNATGYQGTNQHFIFVGDSFTYGAGVSQATESYPAQAMQLAWFKGRASYWTNLGVSGESTVDKINQFNAQVLPLLSGADKAWVFYCAGLNDSNSPTWTMTASQTVSNIQYYANLVKANGGKIIVGTLPFYPDMDMAQTKRRLAVNSGLASVTNLDGIMDWATWLADPANTNYFFTVAEGLQGHPRAAGYALLANNLNDLMLRGYPRLAGLAPWIGRNQFQSLSGVGSFGTLSFMGVNYAGWSHTNFTGDIASYALLQGPDGATYLNAASGRVIQLKVANTTVAEVRAGYISGHNIDSLNVGSFFNGGDFSYAGFRHKDDANYAFLTKATGESFLNGDVHVVKALSGPGTIGLNPVTLCTLAVGTQYDGTGNYAGIRHTNQSGFFVMQQKDGDGFYNVPTSKTHSMRVNMTELLSVSASAVTAKTNLVASILYMPAGSAIAAPTGNDGYYYNSNKVLYWVTATKTNLISDGR